MCDLDWCSLSGMGMIWNGDACGAAGREPEMLTLSSRNTVECMCEFYLCLLCESSAGRVSHSVMHCVSQCKCNEKLHKLSRRLF